METENLLTSRQVALRWACSTKKLDADRLKGAGCPHVKIGRLVRYRLADVIAVRVIAAIENIDLDEDNWFVELDFLHKRETEGCSRSEGPDPDGTWNSGRALHRQSRLAGLVPASRSILAVSIRLLSARRRRGHPHGNLDLPRVRRTTERERQASAFQT
jgi:hypothetical protein